jgi:hypothetical protein
MFLKVIEVEFMGGLMTFDVVTGYGLLCAAVFLTGLFVATHHEQSRDKQAGVRKN